MIKIIHHIRIPHLTAKFYNYLKVITSDID